MKTETAKSNPSNKTEQTPLAIIGTTNEHPSPPAHTPNTNLVRDSVRNLKPNAKTQSGTPVHNLNPMNEVQTKLCCGDCLNVVQRYPDNAFDLIITSSPYADQRRNTYGGTSPDKYV